MTSLQETLPALSAAVPEIPVQTAALIQEGDGIEKAAKELLQELEETGTQAAELFGQVQQAVSELEDEAEGHHTQLEAEVNDLETGLDESLKRLEGSQGELKQAVEGAGEAMGDLHGALTAAGAAAKAAEDEFKDAFGQVADAVRNGQEELTDALEAAAGRASVVRTAIEEARDAVTQGLGGLRQVMRSFLESGRGEVENTAQTLRSLLATHQSLLQEQASRLDQGHKDLLEELRGKVEDDLKGRIVAAVETVVTALGDLSQTATETRDFSHAACEGLETRFEALGDTIQPLPTAIESVKRAAEEVGLPWS